MKTALLEMPVEDALREMTRWRKGRTTEDLLIAKAFRALARRQKVIDLHESMKIAGCDELGRPMLAIVRADAQVCSCYFSLPGDSEIRFRANIGHNDTISIPTSCLPGLRTFQRVQARVPIVPPDFRRANMSKYLILFEAAWQQITKDPMLLEPLGGALYRVIGAWDLTPIEQAVLRGRSGR